MQSAVGTQNSSRKVVLGLAHLWDGAPLVPSDKAPIPDVGPVYALARVRLLP